MSDPKTSGEKLKPEGSESKRKYELSPEAKARREAKVALGKMLEEAGIKSPEDLKAVFERLSAKSPTPSLITSSPPRMTEAPKKPKEPIKLSLTPDDIENINTFSTVFLPEHYERGNEVYSRWHSNFDKIAERRDMLFGLEDKARKVEGALDGMANWKLMMEKFDEMGLMPPINTILLYGPPGTGKSAVVKAIAKKRNLPLVMLSGTKMVSSKLGETAKNFDLIMKEVLKFTSMSPEGVIVFFDEIDAMTMVRSSSSRDVAEMSRVVTGMLTLLDEIRDKKLPVTIIGATNIVSQIDPAILRRFSTRVQFTDISPLDKTKLLAAYYLAATDDRENPLITGNFYAPAEVITPKKFTADDIVKGVSDAVMKSILLKAEGKPPLTWKETMELLEDKGGSYHEIDTPTVEPAFLAEKVVADVGMPELSESETFAAVGWGRITRERKKKLPALTEAVSRTKAEAEAVEAEKRKISGSMTVTTPEGSAKWKELDARYKELMKRLKAEEEAVRKMSAIGP